MALHQMQIDIAMRGISRLKVGGIMVCVCVYVCVCMCMCVYVCVCMRMCMYVYVYVSKRVGECGYVYARMPKNTVKSTFTPTHSLIDSLFHTHRPTARALSTRLRTRPWWQSSFAPPGAL
jgi:hypothetical protein